MSVLAALVTALATGSVEVVDLTAPFDDAYGAEVHHFGPDGHDLSTVRFPETDIAAIARGYGFTGITVRGTADL